MYSSLPAAQDWEFYIQLSAFGEFAVIEESLARYYVHKGHRITGNHEVKARAWKMVYQKHRSHMTVRQRWFHVARIFSKKSEASSAIVISSGYSAFAIMLAIVFFHRVYSYRIMQTSISSVLNHLGIRKYENMD